MAQSSQSYWIETLGCPKNQVDSDKIVGRLAADGLVAADDPGKADLVVVNTCAFIESARQESIDTILELAERLKRSGSGGRGKRSPAKLVATGCMAERYGAELEAAMPELDAVAGFGVPVTLGRKPGAQLHADPAPVPQMDLLNMARPASELPWAYVKIAEGCDRKCGYCAIPQFRGPQRSRTIESICAEIEELGVREVVLIAQDLAAFGRDQTGRRQTDRNQTARDQTARDQTARNPTAQKPIIELIEAIKPLADWVRLLYLYPSDLTDELAETICATQVPYFDLSLQHVSRPLLRRMRRWGDGQKFLDRIADVRVHEPQATFRSNFIVGYPGETEHDHEQLLEFIQEAQLDWCAFFEFSSEDGTHAQTLDKQIPPQLVAQRMAELRTAQETISENRRRQLVGERLEVLVDAPGVARSFREAPEIDGIVVVPRELPAGEFAKVEVTGAAGLDLEAR